VDLHDVRAGDSYESISREYYNDARYAAALQAFNKGRPIQPGKYVEVPPIHVLRKQGGVTPSTAGRVTPVNGSSDWRPMGSTTDPAPAFRATAGRTYIVPKGGSSMPAIAEQVLGDRNRWTEIYDLNPRYLPASVAEGVELKLPDAAPASK
jgi:nucleoid-associated protein YgaU